MHPLPGAGADALRTPHTSTLGLSFRLPTGDSTLNSNEWEPNSIRKSHIERAAKYWRKRQTFHPFHNSSTYDVVVTSGRYPPKAIVAKAHEYATGRGMLPSEFVGSRHGPWHKCLTDLGFKIAKKTDTASSKRAWTVTQAEEGFAQDRSSVFRKRNADLIRARKAQDDNTCQACGFHLLVRGRAIVDCHHLDPLAGTGDVVVTRIGRLVCLCPTCHRIAHSNNPPLSPAKIKAVRCASEQ